VLFRDGTRVNAEPPQSTMDPRYVACTEHRLACDCREAEYAEEVSEYSGEWRRVCEVLATHLKGHKVDVCPCTGCVICRELGLTPHVESGAFVAGVTNWRTDTVDKAPLPPVVFWPPKHGDIWTDRLRRRWCCQIDGTLACIPARMDDAAEEIRRLHGPLHLTYRPDPIEEEVPF
jgi:hypothetical protein